MRALAELVVLGAAVAIVVAIVAVARQDRATRARRWSAETWTRADGTLVVGVRRTGGDERVVRELPPGGDDADTAAELRLARQDAQLLADELNRP